MDAISALKSKSIVLICLFMINQYVTCSESSLPTSESRFVAEKPSSSAGLNGDAFRNAGLFSYLKNLYQFGRERENDDIENDLQSLFNNNDFYRKRTASKGWNKLHGLIGKRNEQLNDDQELAGGITSSELLNNAGLMRSLRANKWNRLDNVWGKREDPSKQKMKSWNQLNGVWG